MQYVVMLEDGLFAADAKARKFVNSFSFAHLFDQASECYHVAKMLNFGARGRYKAHAISTKAYANDDFPFDYQPPHSDARVRQAMGDATGVDNEPS